MHSSKEKGLKDTICRLAMPNTGNTKNRLVPIFKGTTACTTNIHIAPLKINRVAVGSLKDEFFLAILKLPVRDYQ